MTFKHSITLLLLLSLFSNGCGLYDCRRDLAVYKNGLRSYNEREFVFRTTEISILHNKREVWLESHHSTEIMLNEPGDYWTPQLADKMQLWEEAPPNKVEQITTMIFPPAVKPGRVIADLREFNQVFPNYSWYRLPQGVHRIFGHWVIIDWTRPGKPQLVHCKNPGSGLDTETAECHYTRMYKHPYTDNRYRKLLL